jgi:hypothetical protein
MSDTGEHTMISEEFAVLDRAGRLQLPKAHVGALGLKDRVRLRLADDHVEIWPDQSPATLVQAPIPAAHVDPPQPEPTGTDPFASDGPWDATR